MKIVEEIELFARGPFSKSDAWKEARMAVREAIQCVDWPAGSGSFTIYPESGKKTGQGNGVVPIKNNCIAYMIMKGWVPEALPFPKDVQLKIGKLDLLFKSEEYSMVLEWETGNISSSHRAINKILLLMILEYVQGGFFIVPSDKLKVFLTDRIGNIGELRPYFKLWEKLEVENNALTIFVVEHDAISKEVARIPKGTDGRARV